MVVFRDEMDYDGFSKSPRTSMDKLFRTCPVCGKEFAVYNPDDYPLKVRRGKSSDSFLYFDKASHKAEYEAQHSNKVARGHRMYDVAVLEKRRAKRIESLREKAAPMYADRQAGMSYKAIAAKYGLAPVTIIKHITNYKELILDGGLQEST